MSSKKELIEREKALLLGDAKQADDSSSADGLEKVAGFMSTTQNPYPSPFLNLSDMQLPETTIDTFQWCKYYYTFDPLIAGAINALATFPVTEIQLENSEETAGNDENVKLYEGILFKKMNIYKLLIEIGIDYFLYGNCFVMGEMSSNEDKGENEWKHITRLDPSKVTIDYNPSTGEKTYKWAIPEKIKNIVKAKAPKAEYDKIPDIIKRAVRQNKVVKLSPKNIYHFSRATDSMGENSVWGVPIVANVLKLLMYRNILRQAQEAIAREHIVPLRIFYIDRTQGVNPMTDWSGAAKDLAGEIKKSIQDPNYKVVSPVPVNMINAGGQGRSLLLAPEIEQVQSEILAGMNVPREFIFGGVSYSGSSISLRILENQFITYRLLLKDFLQNFVIKQMAKARGEWLSDEDDEDLVTVKLADLKMQDDVQQKQLIVQLNSAGKCSNDYLWKCLGIDSDKMKEAIEQETLDAIELENKANQIKLQSQIDQIDLQTELQKKQMEQQMELQKYQMQLQQQMQQQMQPQQGEGQQGEETPQNAQENNKQKENAQNNGESEQDIDSQIEAEVSNAALKLYKMPQQQIDQVLSKLPVQFKDMVVKKIEELKSSKASSAEVDMRPLPEQKPPRRDSAK